MADLLEQFDPLSAEEHEQHAAAAPQRTRRVVKKTAATARRAPAARPVEEYDEGSEPAVYADGAAVDADAGEVDVAPRRKPARRTAPGAAPARRRTRQLEPEPEPEPEPEAEPEPVDEPEHDYDAEQQQDEPVEEEEEPAPARRVRKPVKSSAAAPTAAPRKRVVRKTRQPEPEYDNADNAAYDQQQQQYADDAAAAEDDPRNYADEHADDAEGQPPAARPKTKKTRPAGAASSRRPKAQPGDYVDEENGGAHPDDYHDDHVAEEEDDAPPPTRTRTAGPAGTAGTATASRAKGTLTGAAGAGAGAAVKAKPRAAAGAGAGAGARRVPASQDDYEEDVAAQLENAQIVDADEDDAPPSGASSRATASRRAGAAGASTGRPAAPGRPTRRPVQDHYDDGYDEQPGDDYVPHETERDYYDQRSAPPRRQPGGSGAGGGAGGMRTRGGAPIRDEYDDEYGDDDGDVPDDRYATARVPVQRYREGGDRRPATGALGGGAGNAGGGGRSAQRRITMQQEYDEDDPGQVLDAEDDDAGADSAARNPNGSVKLARDWTISLGHTKTKMGLNKNCITWRFVHKGEMHVVELFHSTFGGKRTIKVDGVIKVSEKKFVDNGAKHRMECGSTAATSVLIAVEILPVGVSGWTYELFIDGRDYDRAKRYWLAFDECMRPGPAGRR